MKDVDEIFRNNCKCYLSGFKRCFYVKNTSNICIPTNDCLKFMDDKTKTVILHYNRKNRISKLKEL
jgi:hypothetical protein